MLFLQIIQFTTVSINDQDIVRIPLKFFRWLKRPERQTGLLLLKDKQVCTFGRTNSHDLFERQRGLPFWETYMSVFLGDKLTPQSVMLCERKAGLFFLKNKQLCPYWDTNRSILFERQTARSALPERQTFLLLYGTNMFAYSEGQTDAYLLRNK